MKIGVLGSGDVARTLGGGFLKHGHEVMMGTRDPAKLADWAAQNSTARVGSFADATNPIADTPPTNGVLRFFTNLDESLMERLQREFKRARIVKAFNSVGAPCM